MQHTLIAFAGLLLAGAAQAKTCALTIASNDQMQFDQAELKVAGDCTTVELTLKHTGSLPATAMGHNWVLTATAAMRSVALAGMNAGAAANYVKPGDERVLAATPVVGGGGSTKISFSTAKLAKGGDYSFFCSFPGHWSVMKGKLVFG
ncbi:azurin [Pseudorhodoferax soli]|uniref:Azurin n=1 Tax=Pseudorhodoferax soli TaxID=545864 RepID=A0A368XXS0_9BURK|nr:azurin [Pseudorhodoferax soli]RCW72890.1 azurin [Pseudorhodoferax soli]